MADLSNTGQVVGSHYTNHPGSCPSCAPRGYSWTASSGAVDFAPPGGGEVFVFAVNDVGQVVGYKRAFSESQYHAFIWSAQSGMLDLGVLSGDVSSRAFAVNNSGQVVGQSWSPAGVQRAFFWSPSTGMINIGGLGGKFTTPQDISETGQIVGTAYLPGDILYHAFSWTASGGLLDLGTLPGHTRSFGLAVNDVGQVVGASRSADSPTASGVDHSFSWTAQGGMVPIPDSGFASSRASA